MRGYCSLCAKPMEGEGDICGACQERIRAEAMGRQRGTAQEAHKGSEKLNVPEKKVDKVKKDLRVPQEVEEKKPHHFKSMAEYLDYLKGRRR